ncbi:hypothetical protein CASFOL_003935 [Castilleja foliolosa]|uniref:GOLD domain-containing protein n=1 Tax=Castilleja foliolosa TaxID=1961234 RepID=A0ABD3EJ34_9LAMI
MSTRIQRQFFLWFNLCLGLVMDPGRVDLELGHTKCISEDIKSNLMTVGKYQIVNPNDGHPLPESHKVTLRADHKPALTITVDFDWRSGVAAKDWTNVAKKGSVELMELELKKMFDTVQSIHDEMLYLRER